MNSIKKVYNYVFCQFYKLGKFRPHDDSPEWTAILIMSIFQIINLIFIKRIFLPNLFLNWTELSIKLSYLPVLLSILVFNIITFIRKNKYKEFDKIIENESKKEKRNGRIFLSLYMVLSVLIFLVFEI